MEERIQKLIANSGLMSRRAAEEAIKAGRVILNGYTALLGEKADPAYDELLVDGKTLPVPEKSVTVMLNKPVGYVTTMSDEFGRKTVAELTASLGVRLYPVGRLDFNSEGLLLMTNDGELANRLMHPSSGVTKTYRVKVRPGEQGKRIEQLIPALNDPIEIEGRMTVPARVEIIKNSGYLALLDITISEGRNRQVRRLCEHAGLEVLKLTRTREGPLYLGHLNSGAFRYLTEQELRLLKES